jgi:hypothetical protein
MADLALLVVASATASALFAKVYLLFRPEDISTSDTPFLHLDAPIILLLGIALTAITLGAIKGHSLALILLQITLSCLGILSLIWLTEAEQHRLLLYWFQTAFLLTVAAPMLARHLLKTHLPRGPRRSWWKKTLETVIFSAVNMGLVGIGIGLEFYLFMSLAQ